MSNTSIFNQTIEKNGYNFYVIPENYPLFKASKMNYNELIPNNIYFFGLKNMNQEYISDYEKEYGIIYEYKTTTKLELLAIDNDLTIEKLYDKAPTDIKHILDRNYGYKTRTRLSEKNPDMKLVEYLCDKGFQGYALYSMNTDFGGHFHPELAICNASNFVELVGQISNNTSVQNILENQKLKEIYDQHASKKRSTLFMDESISISSKRLFDDDFDGGKKRRKSVKRTKSIKRRKSVKRRKSIKRKRRNTVKKL
jgi:hypothetical protein